MQVLLGGFQLGLVARPGGLRLLQRGDDGAVIDGRQQLARLLMTLCRRFLIRDSAIGKLILQLMEVCPLSLFFQTAVIRKYPLVRLFPLYLLFRDPGPFSDQLE